MILLTFCNLCSGMAAISAWLLFFDFPNFILEKSPEKQFYRVKSELRKKAPLPGKSTWDRFKSWLVSSFCWDQLSWFNPSNYYRAGAQNEAIVFDAKILAKTAGTFGKCEDLSKRFNISRANNTFGPYLMFVWRVWPLWFLPHMRYHLLSNEKNTLFFCGRLYGD